MRLQITVSNPETVVFQVSDSSLSGTGYVPKIPNASQFGGLKDRVDTTSPPGYSESFTRNWRVKPSPNITSGSYDTLFNTTSADVMLEHVGYQ